MAEYSEQVDWKGIPDLGDKFPRYEMRKRKGKWVFKYEKEIDPDTGEPKIDPDTKRTVYKRDGQGRKIKIPTDRATILAHMREKAAKKGLLRDAPLERKAPDSEPVVVASMAASSAP